MIKEFKQFIMQGDVLDLAVGVVIGSAFTGIVKQIVDGLITPLIGLVVSIFIGTDDLNGALSILDWEVRKGVVFKFGDVVSAIITFLITGLVLFLIVRAVNHAKNLHKKEVVEETTVPTAEDYLAEIRDLLKENVQTSENRNQQDLF
ncbi:MULTISPECIES: large conductance mechanosensitive channel protein MscL [Enterococcus]|uniref:large conductance mechanosensitive channel protein MscL n=1 Tax=Enterococcus TaxID=1350 RepID=UPI0010F77D86|nr:MULTISPECIES: large conductance mechanosensitive channel protein MscL [Enterococcus]KAF1302604.1 mechanosensitive ion channel protein MscL [Enterococcus sp. JM9B]